MHNVKSLADGIMQLRILPPPPSEWAESVEWESKSSRGEVLIAKAVVGDRKVEKGDVVIFYRNAGVQDEIYPDIYWFHKDHILAIL